MKRSPSAWVSPSMVTVPLLHRLQQGGLGLGRRAVDLVGQQQLAEDRPAGQGEAAGLEVEQVGADDVAGHQVGRELDAAEIEPERRGRSTGRARSWRCPAGLRAGCGRRRTGRSASARPSRPGRRPPWPTSARIAPASAFTSATFTAHLQFPLMQRAAPRSRSAGSAAWRASAASAAIEVRCRRRPSRSSSASSARLVGDRGRRRRRGRLRRGSGRHRARAMRCSRPAMRIRPALFSTRAACRSAIARSSRRGGPKRTAACRPISRAAASSAQGRGQERRLERQLQQVAAALEAVQGDVEEHRPRSGPGRRRAPPAPSARRR